MSVKVQVVCPDCERMYYIEPYDDRICPNCGNISDIEDNFKEDK